MNNGDDNIDGVSQVGDEDSEDVVDDEQVNNNGGLLIEPTTTASPIPVSSSPPPIVTSPSTITSTSRSLSVSTSTPSLKQRSQPFLHPAARTSPLNQKGKVVRELEKPLLDFIKDGKYVDDTSVKAFVQWSIDNGNIANAEGKPGEPVPLLKLKAGKAFKGEVKLTRKQELETRMKEQLQALSKTSSLSKGSKARSFSQSGIGDSNDQDLSLKSQRVHSPPKP